ncbi:carboxymuconolactone decarboxylase family protein [Actinocorallia aurea]
MARVEPVPLRQWPAAMREALAALTPPAPRHPAPIQQGRPKALNMLGALAHHPELTRAFCTLNGHVMRATTLSLREREMVILRVATLCDSPYEFAQHVVMATDIGMDAAEIDRVAAGPDAPGWTSAESGLLRAVDELIGHGVILQETWSALTRDHDTQQVMDIIFTVGVYETLARLLRTFELDLDDDLTAPSPGPAPA